MSGHVKSLRNIGYYVCPPVAEVKPYPIFDRQEVIEILTGGKIRFEINGEEKVFTRGTVFWHMAGDRTICKTFADDPYHCVVFLFQVNENARPGPRVSTWKDPDETIAFCDECHKAFHAGSTDLDALGDYAYSTIRWKALSGETVSALEYPKPLQTACCYIEQHLGEELSLDRIAARSGISRPYLFALFRKYFGKAPFHFIQERRIGRAKIMLTAPEELSIKEIAMHCGFSELEVFYRQFKKQSGLTPAGYRRKYSVRFLQESQNV